MSTASGARAGEQGGVQGAAQCIQLSELGNLQHFCDNSLEISCSNIISILFLSLVCGPRWPFQSFFSNYLLVFFFFKRRTSKFKSDCSNEIFKYNANWFCWQWLPQYPFNQWFLNCFVMNKILKRKEVLSFENKNWVCFPPCRKQRKWCWRLTDRRCAWEGIGICE